MRYLLLIYHSEADNANRSAEDQQAQIAEYWAFTQEVQEKGVYGAGDALQSTATATTVRVREGKTVTTDGPFAETKEQLGGYYILNCDNLDQAIEYAAKIPDAKGGSIEIRPIMEIG